MSGHLLFMFVMTQRSFATQISKTNITTTYTNTLCACLCAVAQKVNVLKAVLEFLEPSFNLMQPNLKTVVDQLFVHNVHMCCNLYLPKICFYHVWLITQIK